MKSRFLVVCLNPTMQKTLVFGSLSLGRVNRVERVRLDAAGKGVSATRVLVQLGEDPVHLTQVGGHYRDRYLELCSADGLEVKPVEAPVEIRHCITLLEPSAGRVTELAEPGHPVGPLVEEAVVASFRELLPLAHTLILTGSKAPGFSASLYPEMAQSASAAGVRVLLDVRGDDLLGCLPRRPALVKINVSEFSQTFCETPLPEEVETESIPAELFDRMLELHDVHGCEVVLTNGSRETLYVESGVVSRMTPRAVTVVNPIGSGDAVLAGVASGLYHGASLRDAVALGLDCAAKKVELEKPGCIRQ